MEKLALRRWDSAASALARIEAASDEAKSRDRRLTSKLFSRESVRARDANKSAATCARTGVVRGGAASEKGCAVDEAGDELEMREAKRSPGNEEPKEDAGAEGYAAATPQNSAGEDGGEGSGYKASGGEESGRGSGEDVGESLEGGFARCAGRENEEDAAGAEP